MVRLEKNASGEEILSLSVGGDWSNRCIKDFLRGPMHVSATLLKKVKYGGVKVNGKTVTMRATVTVGDAVEVTLPTEASEGIEPIEGKIGVVYEDDHILVVHNWHSGTCCIQSVSST